MVKVDSLPKGKYVIAVSGGVDSMVLLHLLAQRPELELIVAHFNHGIRDDAAEDERLVRSYAAAHNMLFANGSAELGKGASEATARLARYDFLSHVCKEYGTLAIITAHQQDDLLETAFINLIRGTGRRGLSDLRARPGVIRPLLTVPKSEIIAYAHTHGLQWHEDITNVDTRYLRNYIRHYVMPELTTPLREKLQNLIARQVMLNKQIDDELAQFAQQRLRWDKQRLTIPRYEFTMIPQVVGHELVQLICKQLTGTTIERPAAEKVLLFIKTARIHRCMHLAGNWWLVAGKRKIIVEPR